jgi:hypothetical protein
MFDDFNFAAQSLLDRIGLAQEEHKEEHSAEKQQAH